MNVWARTGRVRQGHRSNSQDRKQFGRPIGRAKVHKWCRLLPQGGVADLPSAPMGTLARQSSWIAVLTVAGLVLGFVNMSLLYPRYLPAAEFGLTRLVVSIAIVAAQFAQLGAEGTVIRYYPYFRGRSSRNGGLFRWALLVGSAGAVIAILVLILFHGRLSTWFNDRSGLYGTHGLVVIPLLVAEVYYLLFRGASRAVHRSVAPMFAREFLLRALQTGLIAAHVLWDLPFPLFLGLFACTFVISTVTLIVDLWRAGDFTLTLDPVRPSRRLIRSMARYAAVTLGVGVAGVAAGNVDQVMLAAMLPDGLEYVAYYAVAMMLASVVMVPSRAMTMPALPLIAEAWRRRDLGTIRSLHARSTTVLLTLGFYTALCICVNTDVIYSWMKPGYSTGAKALLILCVVNLVNLAGGLGGSIIGTSRRYTFDASSGLLYLGLNILLDFFFIRLWGMEGVAWSSLVAMVVVVAWRTAFLWHRFKLWPYEASALIKLTGAILVSLLAWWVPSTGTPLYDGLLRCVVITVPYWVVVFWTGACPELIEQAKKIARRVSLR